MSVSPIRGTDLDIVYLDDCSPGVIVVYNFKRLKLIWTVHCENTENIHTFDSLVSIDGIIYDAYTGKILILCSVGDETKISWKEDMSGYHLWITG